MMKSSFKERIARLGPIQDIDRVASGFPVVLSLRPAHDQRLNSITATQALARRGLSLLRAKRIVEEMISRGRIVVTVPKVEDRAHLQADLTNAGIRARFVARIPDIRQLRERLKLTQEQFAVRYGLDVNSLQNWETHRRKLDKTTIAYLRVIERFPEEASEAQEDIEQTLVPDMQVNLRM